VEALVVMASFHEEERNGAVDAAADSKTNPMEASILPLRKIAEKKKLQLKKH
jgi:hypothetical protein